MAAADDTSCARRSDGSGTTKIGVFLDGLWFLDLNGNGVWDERSSIRLAVVILRDVEALVRKAVAHAIDRDGITAFAPKM